MGKHEEKLFLTMFEKGIGQNPRNSSPSVLVPYRNRSDAVDLVGMEPLMFAKVENDGVTKSCQIFMARFAPQEGTGLTWLQLRVVAFVSIRIFSFLIGCAECQVTPAGSKNAPPR